MLSSTVELPRGRGHRWPSIGVIQMERIRINRKARWLELICCQFSRLKWVRMDPRKTLIWSPVILAGCDVSQQLRFHTGSHATEGNRGAQWGQIELRPLRHGPQCDRGPAAGPGEYHDALQLGAFLRLENVCAKSQFIGEDLGQWRCAAIYQETRDLLWNCKGDQAHVQQRRLYGEVYTGQEVEGSNRKGIRRRLIHTGGVVCRLVALYNNNNIITKPIVLLLQIYFSVFRQLVKKALVQASLCSVQPSASASQCPPIHLGKMNFSAFGSHFQFTVSAQSSMLKLNFYRSSHTERQGSRAIISASDWIFPFSYRTRAGITRRTTSSRI